MVARNFFRAKSRCWLLYALTFLVIEVSFYILHPLRLNLFSNPVVRSSFARSLSGGVKLDKNFHHFTVASW